MFLEPAELRRNLDALEEIERASLRLVCQALSDFRSEARDIFASESDLPQDFAEDITREALDRMGVSRIPQRLFGKIDYKRARYVFHPDYAIWRRSSSTRKQRSFRAWARQHCRPPRLRCESAISAKAKPWTYPALSRPCSTRSAGCS